jgi:hypothetical protein
MQLARDSGRIIATHEADTKCPCCNTNKPRYDLEFQAATIENGQAIDSNYIIKNLCSNCLTVCDELPNMDFICAKCGQLTTFLQENFSSESELFKRVFSPEFSDFYQQLSRDGLLAGKRFCMLCTYKIWDDYLKYPDSLHKELEKPKQEYASKKT